MKFECVSRWLGACCCAQFFVWSPAAFRANLYWDFQKLHRSVKSCVGAPDSLVISFRFAHGQLAQRPATEFLEFLAGFRQDCCGFRRFNSNVGSEVGCGVVCPSPGYMPRVHLVMRCGVVVAFRCESPRCRCQYSVGTDSDFEGRWS